MSEQPLPPSEMTKEQYDKLVKQLPVDQIYKDKQPQIEETHKTNFSNDRAGKEPLPGVTGEAFQKDNITVTTSAGEIIIRKQKALDITIFKLTNSPFYQLFMGDIKNNGSKVGMQQMFPEEEMLFELIYQFTHPVSDIYKMIKKDINAYRESVIMEVGDKYTPKDILIVIGAIVNHIGLVNQARVEFESGEVEDKKKASLISPSLLDGSQITS